MGSEIVKKDGDKKPALVARIDDRIATADSPQEAQRWIVLRGKVIEQTIREKEARYKWGFALLAFIVGSTMGVTGHDVFGIFAAGAGLSLIAKEWVLAWIKGGQADEKDDRETQ